MKASPIKFSVASDGRRVIKISGNEPSAEADEAVIHP
jgi:hypothetical protein